MLKWLSFQFLLYYPTYFIGEGRKKEIIYSYIVSITGLKDSDLFLQRYVRAGVATMSEESVVALRKQKLFYILFSTIIILFPFIYYYPTALLFYYPLKLKIVRFFSTC